MTVFRCPRCGITSWNPNDAANGYCGRCHRWTAEEQPAFLALPPFTPAEGEEILSAIAQAISGFESVLEVARATEIRAAVRQRLLVLYSCRTAFAEALMNHHPDTG